LSDLHLPTRTLRNPRSAWLLCCALAVSAAIQPQARASSIADWEHWLENTNSDGSATLDESTLVLTGPNNGSGLSGTTDIWFNALASGMVTFHYYYSTYDPIPDLFDDPLYDYAGLLSGTDFVPFSGIVEPLASRVPYVHPITGALLGPGVTGTESGDIQFGDIQIPVVIGQFFGFRVGSEDNLFLPGILTISELTFTPNEQPGATSLIAETPEPGTWPLLLLAASTAIGIRVRARRASMRKTENA
jgi:hypothetical protein